MAGFEVLSVLMDIKVGSSVQQLLRSPGGLSFLVSTEREECLFSRQPDGTYSEHTRVDTPQTQSPLSENRGKWCTHPQHPEQLILIRAGAAKLHLWSSLEQLSPDSDLEIRLSGIKDSTLNVVDIQACFDSTYIAVTLADSLSRNARSEILFFPTDSFAPGYTVAEADVISDDLAAEVHVLVGTHQNKRLVFLNRKGWICSAASPVALKSDAYDWHFFLPADWLSSVYTLQMKVTPRDGTLIYIRRDEFISVRRGLGFKLDGEKNTTRQLSTRSTKSGYASSMNTKGSVESENTTRQLSIRSTNSGYASSMSTQVSFESQSGWEKRRASAWGSSLKSYTEEGATDHHDGMFSFEKKDLE